MFYIGYIAWEYPTSASCSSTFAAIADVKDRLLQRFPLAKYTSINIVLWGLTLCCMAATKNFASAVVVRFFLGVFEATVTPGFALFTSQWYTKREQGLRTGIWVGFNGWAQIFGGLVAYGIARGVDLHGAAIASWKIVFLVTVSLWCRRRRPSPRSF